MSPYASQLWSGPREKVNDISSKEITLSKQENATERWSPDPFHVFRENIKLIAVAVTQIIVNYCVISISNLSISALSGSQLNMWAIDSWWIGS